MDDSPRLFGTPREWAQDLAIATAIGVFLGFIGPFGSFYGGSTELRVVYWVVNLWIGFTVLSIVVRLSIKAGIRFDLPIWFALPVGVAIGSLPAGFLVALLSGLFWPGNHGRISPFLVWYSQMLVIAEPFSFAYYFLGDRGPTQRGWRASAAKATQDRSALVQPTVSRPTSVVAVSAPSFLDRLPPRLGRDLLCLQMEDHYVRAHTAKSSDLILTPLKDAIAELGDTPGMQVHRSWWVAKAAVAEPVANGRNLSLRLINGLEVPVSRASVAKLKLAGWLENK